MRKLTRTNFHGWFDSATVKNYRGMSQTQNMHEMHGDA
jgi:hypothetical protein